MEATEENILEIAPDYERIKEPLVSKQQSRPKFCLGIFLLLLVDLIWVASSELTRYIFKDVDFNKPYMSTYIKTSMFAIYTLGFVIYSPWRRQCIRCVCDDYPGQYQLVGETDNEDTDDGNECVQSGSLGASMYVPARLPSNSEVESGSENEKSGRRREEQMRKVKFSNIMEVKQLDDCQDAQIARMNYGAALRAKFLKKSNKTMSVQQVVKISFVFSFIFFFGNVAYQEALAVTQVAVVNILSSTSGLFTLVLAAMFPSSPTDKFTLSKLCAVLLSIGGMVLIVFSSKDIDTTTYFALDNTNVGVLWALLGACFYAIYLVLLKKSVGPEQQLNVPMFFGFVGIFCMTLLWPGMLGLHYLGLEEFELPDKTTAMFVVVNGFIGTVVSELLWLWGCFLTSSLVGTMSLGLTIPLSILMDILIRKVHYTWMFYVGVLPVFLSFIAVTVLSNKSNSDPVLSCFTSAFCCKRSQRSTTFQNDQEIPLTQMIEEES